MTSGNTNTHKSEAAAIHLREALGNMASASDCLEVATNASLFAVCSVESNSDEIAGAHRNSSQRYRWHRRQIAQQLIGSGSILRNLAIIR